MTNDTGDVRRGLDSDRASAQADHGIVCRVRRVLAHIASRAPARVFALCGRDPPANIDDLPLHGGIKLVDTPRSASILLVVGRLPPSMYEAAMLVHDAMAHPRAIVQWTPESCVNSARFPNACQEPFVIEYGDLGALASAIHDVQISLVLGRRASSAALLPDVDPAPWRGVGPYGQGGTGMTGGVPYGRPMTGRAPDRDGLELDQLPLRVGPFFAPFPAGLVLDIKLQGDVVQETTVPGNSFAIASPSEVAQSHIGDDDQRFRTAVVHGASVAELERARARHHLRWLAHALRVHGLSALGCRCLRLAGAVRSDDLSGLLGQVRRLRRFLERSQALAWATAGVGSIGSVAIAGKALGPVARAAGIAVDARFDDPAYRALGFQTRVRSPGKRGGDARDRWRQRMDEIVQSLDLAARAGDRRTGGPGCLVEGPHGTLAAQSGDDWRDPNALLIEQLPDLLRGSEWGDMVTTVVSLDLDVRAAAPFMSPLAAPAKPASSPGAHSMPGMHAGMVHGGGHDAVATESPAS